MDTHFIVVVYCGLVGCIQHPHVNGLEFGGLEFGDTLSRGNGNDLSFA